MRVAVDVRVLKNKKKTGVEEYTIQLLRHLLKVDSRNEYSLFYSSIFSINSKLKNIFGSTVPIRHVHFPNKILSLLWKFPGLPKANWLVSGGVDIFLSPHINILPVLDCKKIIVVHDLAFLRLPEFFTRWQLFWHRYMANASIPQADHIIAVSDSTKRDLVAFYEISEENISVIYPGVSMELYPFSEKQKQSFRKKVGLPDRYILSLATLEPRKNIVSVVHAFALLKEHYDIGDLKLVLVGKKGWLYKDIFKLIKNYGLEQDILYRGYIPEDEKNGYLSSASCFVYPSFYEGFGFPPLEAFAVGTPVITSNTSSLPEVVGSAAITVDPLDVPALSLAMRKICFDRVFAQDLRDKGLVRVRKFQWHKVGGDVLRVLEGDSV
ncbi:MAG: glycosyltransferase family 1 protein [bacterium]